MHIIMLKILTNLSVKLKYTVLLSFYSDLNKFNLNPRKWYTKDKKLTAYDNALELYNEYVKGYLNENKILSDAKKKKFGNK